MPPCSAERRPNRDQTACAKSATTSALPGKQPFRAASAQTHPKVHCLHFPSKPRGNTVTRVNTEPDTPDAHCLHCLRYPPCTVMARGSSPSTATSTYAESGSSPCPVKCPALGAACSAPKPSAASLSSASSQKPDSRFYQTVGFADGDGRLKARWMA